MKTLLLMRHSIAILENIETIDKDRSLTKAGFLVAEKAVSFLNKEKINIDLIIHSNAVRTTQTAKVVYDNFHSKTKIISNPDLYYAKEDEMLDIIRSTENKVNNLMIVGHNPTISNLANDLIEQPDIGNFSPGAIAIIEFDAQEWEEIRNNMGTKKSFKIF